MRHGVTGRRRGITRCQPTSSWTGEQKANQQPDFGNAQVCEHICLETNLPTANLWLWSTHESGRETVSRGGRLPLWIWSFHPCQLWALVPGEGQQALRGSGSLPPGPPPPRRPLLRREAPQQRLHPRTSFVSEPLAMLKEAPAPPGATFFFRKIVNTGKAAAHKWRGMSYQAVFLWFRMMFTDINMFQSNKK